MRFEDERRGWLSSVIGRPLLLVFWSLVLWGTLCDLVLVEAACVEGPGAALQRALSDGDVVAAYANLGLAAVAPIVWGLVGIALWPGRPSAGRERR